MSQRPEYIQLEANDDIAHLRDRMSFIRGRRVLIVWPEKGTALNRKLDVVLIQREAKRRSIQLAFVTHDKLVMEHAADLGISTFETIGAAEGRRWRRPRAKIFTRRDHQPEEQPTPEELIDVASRVRNPKRAVSRSRYVVERLLILAGLIAVLVGTAYVVLPQATVTITLASEKVITDLQITADPSITDIDVEQGLIPATTLRAEVQTVGTLNTSGTSALGDNPAIGVVTFTNQSLNNVTLPVGTIVATAGAQPIRFATVAEVTVRGGVGQSEDVAVQALTESAGDQSNVGAGAISVLEGDQSTLVSITNDSPTTGGETRQFATVTQDDKDRLISIVSQQLQASAYEEMQASLLDSQIIIIETIRIAEERSDWAVFDGEVGDIAETLSLDMRAVVEATVIDDRFTRQLLFARLSAQKPSGKVLVADTFTFTRGAVTNVADAIVTFTASGEVQANATIETAQLTEKIAGKSVEEAQAIIAQSANLAAGVIPSFSISPKGFPQLPLLPIRITIEIINA
jgi:hypothetical protein